MRQDFYGLLRRALRRGKRRRLRIRGFRSAAVLVAIVERGGRPALLFTVRRKELEDHGGQICFPGGRCDPGDGGRRQTALREAREELGIPRRSIDVLGLLDDVPTPSGFIITPVVARLMDSVVYRPDPREVESYFDVKLEVLSGPARFNQRGWHSIEGRRYPLPEYRAAGRIIWGATARIVENLLRRIRISQKSKPRPGPGPARKLRRGGRSPATRPGSRLRPRRSSLS